MVAAIHAVDYWFYFSI